MKLNIQTASGRTIATVTLLGTDANLKELQIAFAQQKRKYYPARQRFYTIENGKRGKLIIDGALSKQGVKDGDSLIFKDLGPQIDYQLVFFLEYLGPLVVYAIFYLFRAQIYSFVFGDPSVADKPLHPVQKLAFICWSTHYIKRILETFFVHRFSHGTMPLFNLFKNCSYYWGYAAFVAYFVNHPLYTPPTIAPEAQVYGGVAVFFLMMLFNFICHIQLRNLRPASNPKVRAVPHGFLFELVSCPNYTTEIIMWLAFSAMTQSLPALLFTLTGAGQMYIWAVGKHRRYKKEFTGADGTEKYPTNRKIIIPFIL